MRILVGHNYYQDYGGEDAVFESEARLLRDFNHEVETYSRHNREMERLSAIRNIRLLWDLTFSKKSYEDVRKIIRAFKPEVAHFHNIFYLLTPSVYQACHDEGVPVVQSLHNYRLFSLGGTLYPDRPVDETRPLESLRKGVARREFKNSLVLSWLLARMLARGWRDGTWQREIDAYIVATRFGRDKMTRAGLPAGKISVKPNFVYPDPGAERDTKDYWLYMGRLSSEKGVDWLVEAWKGLPEVPLHVAGDGPLKNQLQDAVRKHDLRQVKILGFLSPEDMKRQVRGAACLIVPSRCYENFPCTVAEAYGHGLGVMAPRLGCFNDIIIDGKTGFLYDSKNLPEFVAKVRGMAARPEVLRNIGKGARQEFERQYTAEQNHQSLIRIYHQAGGSYGRK
jgi:glycosyltransferase involved in cell wall biosynthesis